MLPLASADPCDSAFACVEGACTNNRNGTYSCAPGSPAPTAKLVSNELAGAEGRLEQHGIQLAFAIKTAKAAKTGT